MSEATIHVGCWMAEWQSSQALLEMLNQPKQYPDGPDQAAALRQVVVETKDAAVALIQANAKDLENGQGEILGPYRRIKTVGCMPRSRLGRHD